MIKVSQYEGFYVDDVFQIQIEIAIFNERFTSVDNYEELISHTNCTPAWKEVFDSWKQRGLLN